MKTVALVGTFDTKGEEFAYVSSRLKQLGVGVLSIHCGVFEPKMVPDISNEEVARAAGVELAELEHRHDPRPRHRGHDARRGAAAARPVRRGAP